MSERSKIRVNQSISNVLVSISNETFSQDSHSDCVASSSSIVTEENSYYGFTAEAVLQAEVETVEYQRFIWLSQDGTGGHFVLDLGCKQSFTEILLRNCHNYIYQDRSTETLRFDSLFHYVKLLYTQEFCL